MKKLLYLNFKINVLQQILFTKNVGTKDIENAIDEILGNDYMVENTAEAIKHGSELGVFDTVDDMHKIYNSDKIIDRFNKNFEDTIKSGQIKKIKK